MSKIRRWREKWRKEWRWKKKKKMSEDDDGGKVYQPSRSWSLEKHFIKVEDFSLVESKAQFIGRAPSKYSRTIIRSWWDIIRRLLSWDNNYGITTFENKNFHGYKVGVLRKKNFFLFTSLICLFYHWKKIWFTIFFKIIENL